MKVEYINPFLKATQNVIKTMAFTESVGGNPYVKKDFVAVGDVSGVVGITGEASGSLSISFTEECICNIVSNMFGEKVEEVNDEVRDAVGEITNMISGGARAELQEAGITMQGAIPTVITGKNHSISHMATGPVIAIPFTTDAGPFVVEFCFTE